MTTTTYSDYWTASVQLSIQGFVPLAEMTEVPTRACPFWMCPESHGLMSLIETPDHAINCRSMVSDPNKLLAFSVFCYTEMGLESSDAIHRAVQRLAAFDLYHLIPLTLRTLAEGDEQIAIAEGEVLAAVGCGSMFLGPELIARLTEIAS